MNKAPRVFVEKRRKKDWVVRSVSIIAIIGWICAIIAFFLIDAAKPQQPDFFTKILNINIVSAWDYTLLRISFIVVFISFFTCVIGFIFNMRRHRRKSDRYNKAIIILGFISLVIIIVYFINFAWML